MSKKSKKLKTTKSDTRPSIVFPWSGVAGSMRRSLPPIPQPTLVQPKRVLLPDVLEYARSRDYIVWAKGVSQSKSIIGAPLDIVADGIVVSIPGDLKGANTDDMDPDMRPIVLHALDAHGVTSRMVTAVFDVEDVKQLVNVLSEAVAFVERRKATR